MPEHSTLTQKLGVKEEFHYDIYEPGSSPMLSFFNGSERKAWPYFSLAEMRFVAKNSVLEIEIGGNLIMLEGHNLKMLYFDLLKHRVLEIPVMPELKNTRSYEKDCFVTAIEIIPLRDINDSEG